MPRVCCVCVRSCSRGVAPPPSLEGVVHAPRAVPVQGARMAVPGGLCPSAFPAQVPCSAYLAQGGWWPGPFSPLPGYGSLAHLWAGLCLRGGPASGGPFEMGGLLGGVGLRAASLGAWWGLGRSGGLRDGGQRAARPSLCLP